MGFFKSLFKKKPTQANTFGHSIQEAGNVFMMLFGAVGMVGVIGASTMTVMKGPVKTMSQVTQRTVAENNMIAAGKLALISATTQTSNGDCDGDGLIEPIPYANSITGFTGGGTLPASIGVAKLDPWGNEYAYCVWDHGEASLSDPTDNDANCGGSTNFLAGGDVVTEYTLAIISAGPDRDFDTSCLNFVASGTPLINKTAGADDLVLGYTYGEASTLAGGLWQLDGATNAEISRNLKVTNETDTFDAFTLNSATGDLALGAGATGSFPVVNTDVLQSFTGGGIGTSIDVNSQLLSDSLISTTGNINANENTFLGDDTADTVTIAGVTTIGNGLTVTGTTGLGTTNVTSLNADNGSITTTGPLNAGASTLGATGVSSLSSGGTITAGGNILMGGNFLSNDGGSEGLSIDTTGNITGSAAIAAVGALSGGSINTAGTLGVTGTTTLTTLTAGVTNLGATTLAGTLAMGSNKITGLGVPTVNTDAATKKYVDDNIAAGTGFSEQDPQVGNVTTAGKWCQTDGDSVECTFDLPGETDPQVGTLTNGRWCTSDGTDIDCTSPSPTGPGTTAGSLVDADGDTIVEVEKTADDDTIRFDTAGVQRMVIGKNGKVGIGSDLDGSLTITGAPDINALNTVGQGGLVIQDNVSNTAGAKMRVDANEIQTSVGTSTTNLGLNAHGGNVIISSSNRGGAFLDLSGGRVIDLAPPISRSDAATKDYVDTGIAAVPGDNLGAGGSGDLITDNTIDSSEIQDNTLTANDLAANSVGASELATNSVASTNIIDGTIVAADLNASFLSGVNAATLDTLDSTQFIRSDASTFVTSNTTWTDNNEIRLGNSGDFRMDFDETDTIMRGYNHGASLLIQGENAGGTNRNMIVADPDNHVRLFYAGAEKLRTAANGLSVIGKITDLTNPTAAQDAATKAYVDTRIAAVPGDNLGAGGSGDLITDGTIDSSEIQDNTLTANDLAANSVGASEIATNAVRSAEIMDGEVRVADLANNSVNSNKIVNNSITSGDILDGTIVAADLNASVFSNINAATVDGLNGAQFIRSDTLDLVTASTQWQDNQHVRFGNNNDFSMFHNDADMYMRGYRHGARLIIQGENAGGTNRSMIIADPDNAVNLYFAGGNRLATATNGIIVFGQVTATGYFHSSDARLKKNIEPISGLDLIMKLRGVQYNWKNNGNASAGVIAQEVEKILPRAVQTDSDGMKSVDYDQLIAPLIEAVKELKAESDNLKLRIKALEAK